MEFLDLIPNAEFFNTFVRVMTPLLFAALGIMISEKVGLLNIGMEGMMLTGALLGVLVSAGTGSVWLGLAAAVLSGGFVGLVMALSINVLGAHFIIVGIAINVAAASGTTLALFLATGEKGMSGSLKSGVLPSLDLPFLGILSGHHILSYVAVICAIALHIFIKRMPLGLHFRAVGVDPHSAAVAGIPVARVQAIGLMMSGMLGGAAGAYLSMGYVSWFAQNMTAGRGFVAIAIAIMGMGNALWTLASTALIAVAETLTIRMQSLGLPSELLQMVPYLVPIVVLTIWSSRRYRNSGSSGDPLKGK